MRLSPEIAAKLTDYISARYLPDTETGCWNWQLSCGSHGYPQGCMTAATGEKVSLAHRLSYLAANLEIPAGYDIDHLCRNRRCVNPSHLEAVTQHANRSRQFGIDCAAHHLTADGCPKGHGPYRNVSGRAVCPACARDRNARYSARKMQAA